MSLTKEETTMVREILSVMRKAEGVLPDFIRDEKDLSEVLKALSVSGYMLVPRGYLSGMRKMLDKIFKQQASAEEVVKIEKKKEGGK